MTGVISLDEFNTSGNDSSSDSTDTATESDAGEEIPGVLLEFEAERDRIEKFRRQQSEENFESLIEFAEELTELGEEALQALEAYRAGNDIHRIKQNELYDYADEEGVSFEKWAARFYGDYDDPESGTYNDVQSTCRDRDLNLFFYRVLAPTPDPEHWPDENAVLWQEFDTLGWGNGEQDTHIFVTGEFVEQYGDFTMEVDGEQKPRPPTNEELKGLAANSASSSGGASDPDLIVDPSEHTVPELRDAVQEALDSGASKAEFKRVLEAEEQDKDRKTGKKAIRGAMNQAADRDNSGSDSDTSDASDDAEERASEIIVKHGLSANPEAVAALIELGKSEEEIVNLADE